ncbi:MAG: hypothetical protein AB1568_17295 [Thermodesulfobacteriota bacterium]
MTPMALSMQKASVIPPGVTVDHGLRILNALILAVTAENHCRLLLSQDVQHGFIWRGVTVVNPYLSPSHPPLESLLCG